MFDVDNLSKLFNLFFIFLILYMNNKQDDN